MREAAARTQCINNLKQIGIAAHGYHDTYKKFAPGIETTNYICIIARLLPYAEQDPVYKMFSSTLNTPTAWWNVTGAWNAAQVKIPILLCPSDTADSRTNAFAYVYTSGYTIYGGTFSNNTTLAATNYLGCAGVIGDPGGNSSYGPYRGMFYTNSSIKLNTISDGTSNTLMFGESCGDDYAATGGYRHTWMGAGGSMATYWGTAPYGTAPNGQKYTTWHQYGSKHTGVVNFCFGDASVRTVSDTYQAGVQGPWWGASGVADGRADTSNLN